MTDCRQGRNAGPAGFCGMGEETGHTMEQGIIFKIQRYCVNDGPGIRTVVFLKGCPLRCAWCHNPESQAAGPEILYCAEKCVGCGACARACANHAHGFEDGLHHFRRENCVNCGACVKVCPGGALEAAGRNASVDEVLEEVLKDRVFYDKSGGGLTLSGGEPLSQPAFARGLLKEAKRGGLHTCVETCGYAPEGTVRRIAEYTDLFLYDWKLTDDALHRKYTGVSNGPVRHNLEIIDGMGVKTVLRCPVIPRVNDTEGHFAGIAELANSLKNILRIEIEPYHTLGGYKYAMLGRKDSMRDTEVPEPERVGRWMEEIRSRTDVPVKKA